MRVAFSTERSMSLRLTSGVGFGVGDALGVGEGVGGGVGVAVGVGEDTGAAAGWGSSGTKNATQPRPIRPTTHAAAVRVRNQPGKT